MAEPKRKENFNPDLKIFENADGYDKLNRKTSNEKETDTSQQEEKSTKDEQKNENYKYIEKALSLYNKSLTILKILIHSDNKDKENIKIILENLHKELKILHSDFQKKLENSKTEEEKEQIYTSYKNDMYNLNKNTIYLILSIQIPSIAKWGLVILGILGAIKICKNNSK